jgi:carboxymethylenebutenolidase
VFTIGFCMGGRMSFLAATLGLGLSGVIGMYGTLVGPWRNDAPAPVDVTDRIAAPVLGLFGGADAGITTEAIAAFDAGLTAADVEHRLVTYPGAPHSFFDRKAVEFADASAAAWDETLAFIGSHTP